MYNYTMPKLTTHDKLSKLERITFTKVGYEKLLRKLERLRLDRPAAVKELARARELGDLSENGLYTAAKARLNSIDGNIFRIEMTIKFADVADSKNSTFVQIGSRVKILENNEEVEYKIVGDTEANPRERKVTQASPIGSALIGKKEGEDVEIQTPSGGKSLKILSIK
jgi:transcription elongation factor GreA